ncbi:MAG: VPLPA-CTERM sorting domain-containing protein [Marinicaulis sp.]|nr:VPLPA-CTERM sorting domain-containing protein [Marinicaulis sp.]NNE41372.1 VPLPA-CTERM sorting domain-containing protein [Marinicaulis sp.]NNL89460.1 VPLPA-CTERM sorting domain-containing protein [Marinicaulis sp.]
MKTNSIVVGLTFGLVAAGHAAAAVLVTDESAFLAGTDTVAVDLPDLGNTGTGDTTVGPLTFSSNGGGATDLFMGTSGVEGSFGPQFSTLIDGHDIAISGPENFAIDIDSIVTAFAFEIHEPSSSASATPTRPDVCNATCFDTTFEIRLFNGVALVDTLIVNATDDSAFFVGIMEAAGFDRVEVFDVTATNDNEFFGSFRVGDIDPIPLPAAAALILAGLAGLGLIRRRNRR